MTSITLKNMLEKRNVPNWVPEDELGYSIYCPNCGLAGGKPLDSHDFGTSVSIRWLCFKCDDTFIVDKKKPDLDHKLEED